MIFPASIVQSFAKHAQVQLYVLQFHKDGTMMLRRVVILNVILYANNAQILLITANLV